MKIKLLTNLCLSLLFISIYSCSKSELYIVEQYNNEIGSISIKRENPILNLKLKASNEKDIVEAMHKEALSSLGIGLEESVYFNDILSDDASTRVVSEKSIL